MIVASVLIVGFGVLFAPLFQPHSPWLVTAFLCLGLFLMGLTYGPCGTFLAEIYPVEVRYTGASLSFNLAGILWRRRRTWPPGWRNASAWSRSALPVPDCGTPVRAGSTAQARPAAQPKKRLSVRPSQPPPWCSRAKWFRCALTCSA